MKDHKLYIGFTADVFKRLAEHNAGLNTSTAPRRPFRLIYFEGHLHKEDALRRESYFKSTSGKRTLQIILKKVLAEVGYKSKSFPTLDV